MIYIIAFFLLLLVLANDAARELLFGLIAGGFWIALVLGGLFFLFALAQ